MVQPTEKRCTAANTNPTTADPRSATNWLAGVVPDRLTGRLLPSSAVQWRTRRSTGAPEGRAFTVFTEGSSVSVSSSMGTGSRIELLQSCYLVECRRNVYSVQLHRLASFTNWPHRGKLSASSFSSAGFYYTGRGDEVTCFLCGLTLGTWTAGVHPLTAHRELCSGRCDFVSSVCRSADVPPVVAGVPVADCVASHYASMPLPPLVSLGSLLKDPRRIERERCHQRSNAEESSGQHQRLPHEEAAKYELYRLQTFSNVWEHSSIVTPRELAAAGFHYTGPGDRVQCAFCQGLLRNWEHGDRAMEQHAQHFTYCRFVQGHDVGNVPIPFSELEHVLPERQYVAEIGLGISYTVPKQPDMAVEARRFATFTAWPSIRQLQPELLAKAGFFFLGTGTAVQCFYCDGIVTEWPDGSDPWTEHARRFPFCPFVEQVKGRDFVLQHNVTGSASAPTSQTTSFVVDPREIRARMDSPKVRILLQMDYPLDLVREVIQKRLKSVGDDHKTSEDLLTDVFVVHDDKQRMSALRVTSGRPPTASLPVIVAAPRAGATATVGSTNLSGQLPAVTSGAREAEGRSPDVQPQPSLTAMLDPNVAPTATRLHPEEENRQLKTQLTCKICMDSLVGIVFLPCGHLVCCPACAPALTTCPICRVSIRGTVRTLL